MAVHIEAHYGKTIGLPNYSSHKFCVSIKSEVQSVNDIAGEVQQLYSLLQESVDQNIADPGYVPAKKGATGERAPANNGQGSHTHAGNSHPPRNNAKTGNSRDTRCSPKQLDYIESLSQRQNMNARDLDILCDQMFGKTLDELNRMEASGLIDEIKNPVRGSSNGRAHAGNNGVHGAKHRGTLV